MSIFDQYKKRQKEIMDDKIKRDKKRQKEIIVFNKKLEQHNNQLEERRLKENFNRKLEQQSNELARKTKALEAKLDKVESKRNYANRFITHAKERRERQNYKMSKEGIKEKLQEIKDFKKIEKIRKYEAKRRDEKKVFKSPTMKNFGGFGEGVFSSSFNSGRPVVRKKRR